MILYEIYKKLTNEDLIINFKNSNTEDEKDFWNRLIELKEQDNTDIIGDNNK